MSGAGHCAGKANAELVVAIVFLIIAGISSSSDLRLRPVVLRLKGVLIGLLHFHARIFTYTCMV